MHDGRIWLTGAGLVTSLGATRESTWTRLVRGERGLGPLDLFDVGDLPARAFGVARGFALPQGAAPADVDITAGARAGAGAGGRAKGEGLWSRTAVLAWNAAREALAQAELEVRGKRVGLVVGGTTGGTLDNELLLATLHPQPRPTRAEALAPPLCGMTSHPLSSTADALFATLGPFARMACICSACSSGASALLLASLWLRAGEVDAVVAGGTDALCRLTVAGFSALQAVDPGPCRPFDRHRRGLNLGEGAGFAVLELARDAQARGARPIAELAGWASHSEAHHITNPEASGATAARTIEAALRRAGLSPKDVDYVNAHGTATPLNDAMEAAALTRALGDDGRRIAVSSSKGQIGHTLGAAGAIEAIVAALAVERGALPPTAGLEDPDPACALVHVPGVGREARVRAALSSSFGFGGMDTVLVVAHAEAHRPTTSRASRPLREVVVTGAASLTAVGLEEARTADMGAGAGSDDAAGGPVSFDTSAVLDAARARRLDRPARLSAVAAMRAATEMGEADRARTAVVLGTAFGSVDPTAAFMRRLTDKGLRFASPAEFPNLVPSSPVGHVSIYGGFRGPAIATADLDTGGECAVRIACDLVASGDADAAIAGAVEEASVISDHVFRVLFDSAHDAAPETRPAAAGAGEGASERAEQRAEQRAEERAEQRAEQRAEERAEQRSAEGAGVLLLEAADAAAARGARPLARVVQSLTWHDGGEGVLARLVPPALAGATPACVVLASEDERTMALLRATPWADVPRVPLGARARGHEARGAVALVVATSLLAAATVSAALVLGSAKGRGYAFVLRGPRLA